METNKKKYNYKLKCITCGKMFLANRSTAKYCCSFCKNQQTRIQKGTIVKFDDEGFVVVKPKKYETRGKTDKQKIPNNAVKYNVSLYVGKKDNNCIDWEGHNSFDKSYQKDVLQHVNKGYYIAERRKNNNLYRLVKEVYRGKGYSDWNERVKLEIYEWTKNVYKRTEIKKYYDEEVEIIDF